MKKIILSLTVLFLSLTGLVSCTDETYDPVATNGENIALSSPTGGNYTLTALNASSDAFTAKWTSSYFGFQAAVRYYLQASKGTGTFSATPGEVMIGDYSVSENTSLEKAITNRQLNVALLGAGGSIGTTDSYKIRIVAKLLGQSSNLSDVKAVSNEVTITANPYDTFDEFDRIFVAGNYGAASTYSDWSGNDDGSSNSARLYSAANNGQYEGFVWMNVASPEFKFTNPGWGNHKGVGSSAGTLASPGSNILLADGAGTYFFTVNWDSNTYSVEKRQVAIIGAATPSGWGSPTYLTFDTNPSSPYYRMYTMDLSLSADEFLIRLKDDWSVKMGTLSGSTENVTTGGQYKIKLGGGNMKVPTAGNYKVVLDIRNSANYNLRLMPI
jgi:hypothetical protein